MGLVCLAQDLRRLVTNANAAPGSRRVRRLDATRQRPCPARHRVSHVSLNGSDLPAANSRRSVRAPCAGRRANAIVRVCGVPALRDSTRSGSQVVGEWGRLEVTSEPHTAEWRAGRLGWFRYRPRSTGRFLRERWRGGGVRRSRGLRGVRCAGRREAVAGAVAWLSLRPE